MSRTSTQAEAVRLIIDLALVNFHLLWRHIDGAIAYAAREGLSLEEVFAAQLLLLSTRGA